MATNLKSKAMEHIQEGCKNPLIKLLLEPLQLIFITELLIQPETKKEQKIIVTKNLFLFHFHHGINS